MNWKQLKEFSNSLDEKQLERKVVLWREDEAISDINSMTLEEDYYINEDDEGCYPESEAKEPLRYAVAFLRLHGYTSYPRCPHTHHTRHKEIGIIIYITAPPLTPSLWISKEYNQGKIKEIKN